MSEWKKVKLGEVLTFFNGKAIRKSSGSIPIYGSNGIIGYTNQSLYNNAIIIGRVGTSGSVALCQQDFWASDNTIVAKSLENDRNVFFYYLLKTMNLDTYAGGSAQPLLTQTTLKSLKVTVPSLATQHRIATILSRYDSLIENYQKQIMLLEEAAQRLYKEWFVDLNFPGHESTEFLDGVPEGWERKKIGDLISKTQRTKQVPTNCYQIVGSIPIIDQSKNYIAGYTDDEECKVSVEIPFIVFGDHTRVLKFIPFSFAKGADGTQLIMTNDLKRMPQSLFYNSLKHVDLSNYSYARHFKYLKEEQILVPTELIADRFDSFVSKWYKAIQQCRKEINILTEARDRLLPKLMSGEIEV